jgi:tetratricopeptide (TPR) repeat protein
MGYEPVWQDIEPSEGGELLQILRERVGRCNMMLQLVTERYGAEAPWPTPEFGRVSYTQFEALYAEKLGQKVIYCFLNPGFPADPVPAEPEELRALQVAYRERLKETNRLRQTNIATAQDLELSVRRIKDELDQLRRQGERRYRKLVWIAGAAAAGVAAMILLVVWQVEHQRRAEAQAKQDAAQVKDELAELRKAVRSPISPQPLAQGQTQRDPLPPAIVAKARELEERGNAEDRALAKIALKQHDAADRIIQELKNKPGNPVDEAFGLLLLEGDNWYQAGDADKAVAPYEKAFALKPENIRARNSLTLAHTYARQGRRAEQVRRAIEIAEGTLALVSAGSMEWAMTQNNLGNAWDDLPTGVRLQNLQKSIAAYEAALTVYTKEGTPREWAMTENNLGNAWGDLPTRDRAGNLQKAIAAYESALTVRTREAAPADWAATQNNLGNAWSELPTGDRARNLQKAIAAYEGALTVRTREASPYDWAATQNNLGAAWRSMPADDRTKNLRKAIAAYEAALTVRTRESAPLDWAATQNNLGSAWAEFPTGDRAQNLQRAIAAFEAALTVYTREAAPMEWATIQFNLSSAWSDMPGDRGEMLARAIACGKAALEVYTAEAFPPLNDEVTEQVAALRKWYEETGAAATRPFDGIRAAK